MISNEYSELYTNYVSNNYTKDDIGCDYCILPYNYSGITIKKDKENKNICEYCENHKSKQFLGENQLLTDLSLQDNEKVGVMVSGGKDSLFAWLWLVEKLGNDRVVGFNHNKVGMVHEYALQNLANAKKILDTELIYIDDHSCFPRFKKNLEAFLQKPEPAMVRAVLCSGCRYGITMSIFQEGEKLGISKFISAASYLELAPFKSSLMKIKGGGSEKYGLILGLAENSCYCHGNNLDIILKDDDLVYKTNVSFSSTLSKSLLKYKTFDIDDYFPNEPEYFENKLKSCLKWSRPERSWHFDCLIENFKDFFYYGMLGYTETDFRLCQMIRYNLISREQAIKQINVFNSNLKNSLPIIIELLNNLELHHLIDKFTDFHKNSIHF